MKILKPLIVVIAVFAAIAWYLGQNVSIEIQKAPVNENAQTVLLVGPLFGGSGNPITQMNAIAQRQPGGAPHKFAPPVVTFLMGEGPLKLDAVQAAIAEHDPAAIVLMASHEFASEAGWSARLNGSVQSIAGLSEGRDLFIVTHPPAASELGLGFGGKADQINTVVTAIASDAKAKVIPAGLIWVSLPEAKADALYSSNKRNLSKTGDYVVALAMLNALGGYEMDQTLPRGMALEPSDLALVQQALDAQASQ